MPVKAKRSEAQREKDHTDIQFKIFKRKLRKKGPIEIGAEGRAVDKKIREERAAVKKRGDETAKRLGVWLDKRSKL